MIEAAVIGAIIVSFVFAVFMAVAQYVPIA